jgi:CDP-L-myo-inositol myo-inositolphosphotransferase
MYLPLMNRGSATSITSSPIDGERPAVRKAVILAAGRSSRMSALSKGRSKAMLELGGVSLFQRCASTLRALGLEELIVVTGHDARAVRRHARSVAGPPVRVIDAHQWRHGNGKSLEAAEPFVAGEEGFLLVTVDHVFAPASLRDLVASRTPAVLVDRSPTPAELAEGTKVVLDGDRVVALGKELASTTIDCGAFILPPEVFDAHREALRSGDASLSAAVSTLAGTRHLRAVDVPADSWTDVDAPEDLRAARRRLRRSLGKSGDGPISRALNRPVSTRISMALARFAVSPDLVSVVVAAFGLVTALLLAGGRGLAGGIAAQAVSILDGVDGELARLRLLASRRGAMLDGILDRLVDAAVIAGLGVWASASQGVTAVIWVTAAALTGAMLSMASKDRASLLGLPSAPERWIGWLLGGRDGRMLVIAVSAIVGQPLAGLVVVAVTSLLSVAIRVGYVLRAPGHREGAGP